jgi:hypothetical protein
VRGNSAYQEWPLRNPANDARDMATMLRKLGFVVLSHENATKHTMEMAILEFGRRLAGGGVGFFYYAGHGLQVRGHNYLVPVDAQIEFEAAARVVGIDVDLVLEQMAEARNRVNIVILDACRNNPFEQRLRGGSHGLAAVDAARGTLIAYATAPGSVAIDGEGANGLYTEELLQALRVPGLKIEDVFKRVRAAVSQRSNGIQTPWESSSLTGDLVVNMTANAEASAAAAPTADREVLFWSSIKDSQDPAMFRAYLDRYPSGTFAEIARRKLATAAVAATASKTSGFDGIWAVTLDCPRTPDGTEGFTFNFFVTVKDGLLHGQYGLAGQPGSLTLDGSIQPDGTSGIIANGISGDPKYNVRRGARGSRYSYRATAHFEGTRGTGTRIDTRHCDLVFSRQ